MFDHVLVDEYQDTNALQADILEGMRPAGTPRNLTVVGDDAQSIYGFRAATVRNILEFPERFPGATVVTLEQNYRSITPILAASNAVIALSPQRHEKTLWSERPGARTPTLRTCLDEAEQCDAVCRTVLEHREEGVPLKEQAVLFRAAPPQRPARGRARPAQHPVREVRRPEVPGGRAREGHAGDAARAREPVRRGELVPRAPAPRRDGTGHRAARDGRARRAPGRRRPAARRWSSSSRSRSRCPKAAATGSSELRAALARLPRRDAAAAGRRRSNASARSWSRCSRGGTTRRRARSRDLDQLELLATGYETRGPVPQRADAGPAVVHRRPRGAAAPGRGLPRALDDPLGEGAGVGRRARDPRGRRHDPVATWPPGTTTRSRRSAACSTSR